MKTNRPDDLVRRALAAYYRGGGTGTPLARVIEHDGRQYVVLGLKDDVAVYRVRNDGMLKGLKRWPAAIEEDFA